jgi:zinc/manganese transport system permease protein
MFSGLMLTAWAAGTIVAIVAGVVGFFTVLRGSTFVAHALPNGAFAGAAGASLLGLNTVLGLGVFAMLGALGIGSLGRRGRHDVATALVLVAMLGLGALFLSMSVEYAPEIYSLLFGEILGVSVNELLPTAVLGAICIGAIVLLYRPLMLTSVITDVAEARGVRTHRVEMYFLLVVALATTMTVPVVGALLMFTLMVGPAGAARSISNHPAHALALSVLIAVATIWLAIVAAYVSNWPIGFFVGTLGAGFFIAARGWAAWRRRRVVSGRRASPDEFLVGGVES